MPQEGATTAGGRICGNYRTFMPPAPGPFLNIVFNFLLALLIQDYTNYVLLGFQEQPRHDHVGHNAAGSEAEHAPNLYR